MPKANSQSDPRAAAQRHSSATRTFGMCVFVASLAVLFAASIAAYLLIRLRSPEWPPPGMPRLPAGLWLSTFILIGSSMTLHLALHNVRQDRRAPVAGALLLTSFLGIAFLVSQIAAWSALLGAEIYAQANLYAFTFFVLTGLHGLHVIGGLIPLGVITRAAYAGAYARDSHQAMINISIYWHFLDVVWIIMFAAMMIGG